MNYFKRVLIAVDQLAATVFFGTEPDETISAMAHRRGWRWLELAINALFFDSNHCRDSYLAEMNGTQNHPEYRS